MRGPSKPILLLVAGLAAAVFAGCASHPGRSVPQALRVETPGCARATCTLANDLGIWRVDPAPGEARVMTSEQALEVACSVDDAPERLGPAVGGDPTGGEPHTPLPLRSVSPGSGVAGAAIGAGIVGAAASPLLATPLAPLVGAFMLVGAATGAGVGLSADSLSRAWSYPDTIRVALRCEPPVPRATTLAAAPFGIAVRSAVGAERAGEGAVVVTEVAPGGRAAAAGLAAGDRIAAVGGVPLPDAAALEEQVVAAQRQAAASLALHVVRAGRRIAIVLPLPGATR